MNTSELVTKLTEAHGVSKVQVKAIIDDFLKEIVDAAANGAEVSLPGFGKFKVKETPEREGRNPASGEKMRSPACFAPRLMGPILPERLSGLTAPLGSR